MKIIGSWSNFQRNGKVQYIILNLGCMNGRNDMAYRLLNIEFKVIACVNINYIHSNNDNVDNEKIFFFYSTICSLAFLHHIYLHQAYKYDYYIAIKENKNRMLTH